MSVEFEHFIGLNTVPKSSIFHPNGQNYIFSSGGNLIIGDLVDGHSQEFLRRHDDTITCIAVSSSGTLLASGQKGENSDIYVWDFATRQVIHHFEEHDVSIQDIAFSEDEKIFASLGHEDDGKLVLWDLSNGCIIAAASHIASGTLCVAFAGFIKDIKRRNTSHYMLCTAGMDGLVIWDLDPYSGDLTPLKLTGEARATLTRQLTAIAFSDDYEYVYGATTSGDFIIGSFRNQKIVQVVQATKLRLNAILFSSSGGGVIVLGCGDATIKIYAINGDYRGQLKLDGSVISLSPSPDKLEVIIEIYLCSRLPLK